MSTARKIAGIFFVHESLVDGEIWSYEFEELKREALWHMSEKGVVDKSTLEVETLRPAEFYGERMPFAVTEDGLTVPGDYVAVRFSAMAVPHV